MQVTIPEVMEAVAVDEQSQTLTVRQIPVPQPSPGGPDSNGGCADQPI